MYLPALLVYKSFILRKKKKINKKLLQFGQQQLKGISHSLYNPNVLAQNFIFFIKKNTLKLFKFLNPTANINPMKLFKIIGL